MLDVSFGDIKYSEIYYSDALDICYLSPATISYINEIKARLSESSRASSLCALYELYCLLEKNGIGASNFEIKKTSNGKPYFVNSDICFSISHTHHKYAVAISDTSVGIDIEDKILTKEKMQSIAKRYFAKDEIEYAYDRDSFLRVWTFKEAYAKMKGVPLPQIMGKTNSLDENVKKIYKQYEDALICICSE